jgi:hypothetical protein
MDPNVAMQDIQNAGPLGTPALPAGVAAGTGGPKGGVISSHDDFPKKLMRHRVGIMAQKPGVLPIKREINFPFPPRAEDLMVDETTHGGVH